MTNASALSVLARERREEPFVFFRGRRGHFRWLSYSAAGSGELAAPAEGDWAPPEVHELLRFASGLDAAPSPAESAPPFAPPTAGRDVWISWRPLAEAAERRLAAAAVRGGAAIVVERRERYPVDLFLWARPTVVSAPAADLAAILGGLDGEAPRWRRRSWLRQKLGRLRSVLVEGAAAPAEVERLEGELRRLLPGGPASVRRLESAGGPGGPALV